MIVPSIDVAGGRTVQLVGGEAPALDAGDPRPWAVGFGRTGEVAVIDLDAAKGEGDNAALIESLLDLAPCRVGGGIRDVHTARRWLDAGAAKIILGTAARPEILTALPRERLIAALDGRHGELVVEGWRRPTGVRVVERMAALAPHVGGFLVTFVEREGRLGGIDLEAVRALREAAGEVPLTVAGGVTTAAEVAALDAMGVDAQVGMALYTGRFDVADALAAMLRSDRADGLWPTVVCDPHGVALGLVYSSVDSLRAALSGGRGVYWSRRRQALWEKGAHSGARQALLQVALDCDRDALRFVVRQQPPGFCHRRSPTCWGEAPSALLALEQVLAGRRDAAAAASADADDSGSYVRRLLGDAALLRAKLFEEAGELAAASGAAAVAHEAADVFFFAMVALTRAGVGLEAVAQQLSRRARRVCRRRGDAKPGAP